MSSFEAEYSALQQDVNNVLQQCSRRSGDVKILAVSKTFPVEAIREAYSCGVRMFGENKIQELAVKVAQLPDDVEWHFIGHLQSNKAAKAVELADWIHSVDSLKLLQKLDRCAGEQHKRPVILLEVNSGEEAKSGISYDELFDLARAAAAAENLDFRGLMTMAPLCDDPAVWQKAFENLASARDELEKALQITLPELSMGMTGDFKEAIAAGSTIVRIGSRLFGNRCYSVEQ
jgi:pyridoxal phosphate enzyme (YggS family)